MPTSRLGRIAFPGAVVLVVAVMVVPLPAALLDVLIVCNLAAAVLILLVSMNVTRALEFSSFPSLLLIVTLFRLGLNVSTARAVLSHGHAGEVINTFGSVVVGGSLVVGLVIFLILTLVQFVVISSGSGRVAEVSARFTLDAMPGKQMAIDADLNAGLIDEDGARRRRKEVADEADFYGAMDGSSKFVKGDAIAGLVICMVNLIGGFLVGVVQKGMPIGDAVQTYSLLTVGDGLVAQIPALLVSISAGLIVTRAAGEADLGSDVLSQLGRQSRALRGCGFVIGALGLMPGMPKLPFFAAAITLVVVGTSLSKRPVDTEVAAADDAPSPSAPEQLAVDARVEPLELDLAYDLVELADGGDLLDRVGALRRKVALELGLVIPAVRTRDDPTLPPHTYAVRVHGVELGRGEAPPGRVLVIGDDLTGLPGTDVREPVFGLAARWVPAEMRATAELRGNTVVDRSALVVTHLSEIVRRRAGRLLGRTDVKALLDAVRSTDPAVVDDLNAAAVTTAEVQRVLATLLDDGVPIRDLVRILEAIGERARTSRTPEALVEAARVALGPAISSALASGGTLLVATLDPMAEAGLAERLRVNEHGSFLELGPDAADTLVAQARGAAETAALRGVTTALLCAPALRSALAALLRPAVPGVAVLAYPEIGDHLDLEVIASIDPFAGVTPATDPMAGTHAQ